MLVLHHERIDVLDPRRIALLIVLANLCVSYIMTSQNEKAEDLMRRIEREEEQIALENPGPGPLAFKVMVTAPAAYSFVPNSGFLEPGGAANIRVTRFSQPEDPEEPRDKIQCVSRSVAAEEVSLHDRPEPSVFSGDDVHRVKLLIQYAVGLGAGAGRGGGGGIGKSASEDWGARFGELGTKHVATVDLEPLRFSCARSFT